MTLTEAMAVLGVVPGTTLAEVRSAYRDLVRSNHPDLVHQPQANERTARVTAAFATVRSAVLAGGAGIVPEVGPPPPPCDPPPRWSPAAVGADTVDGDTIAIDAPAAEAFALLLDAAATVGGIGYVDRHLGILEVIVRFEGGPTCSVLITLQGRAFGTDAFCTIDSIEAAPAPPVGPVVDALVEALTSPD